MLAFSLVGLWALPRERRCIHGLRTKGDWVGAALASAFMALICYLLAMLSASPSRIKSAEAIAILCLAVLALPAFVGWVHYRATQGQPALIPNALWKNSVFSSICATVILSNGVVNGMELFASLFFQDVQHLSALQASIRILPSLVVAVTMNFLMGLFVHTLPALWIVTSASLLCSVSPLLMAIIHPSVTYWANAFVAQLLQPVSFGALYTVGLIVITGIFPPDTQALAGAVFNTCAQFGNALALAVLQVISTVVTDHSRGNSTARLMDGYRACFWTMFGCRLVCTGIGAWALRRAGKVGLKRE